MLVALVFYTGLRLEIDQAAQNRLRRNSAPRAPASLADDATGGAELVTESARMKAVATRAKEFSRRIATCKCPAGVWNSALKRLSLLPRGGREFDLNLRRRRPLIRHVFASSLLARADLVRGDVDRPGRRQPQCR